MSRCRYIRADRIEFELCESNMPQRYRDFCRRVINDENLSPTADVVRVTRCRDCINRRSAKVNEKGFLVCSASGMEITDDDYCSYGKGVM